MKNKVIFFDIDGTLLSTGGAGQLAMERALTRDFRISFPFEGVLTAGRTDRGIAIEIFERYTVEDTPENRRRFENAYLSHLPDTLKEAPGLLLPGVNELLSQLAMTDLTLSILTGNYEEGARIKLQHYELDHYFVSGGFGDDHPDRDDVARMALNNISSHLAEPIPGRDTMVIGDTPADIKCARAIGAIAVGVATGHYSEDQLAEQNPDLVLTDFADATTVARQLSELF